MKKYLALVTAILLTISSASAVFAIHAEIPSETQAVVAKGATQISIGGDLLFRGTLASVGMPPTSQDLDSSIIAYSGRGKHAVYESRVRLQVDAQVSPGTTGRIHMEAGVDNASDYMIWGTSGNGAAGSFNQGDSKMNSMRVLESWIQHKGSGLLGIPAYFKVGHMPIRIGNGLFYDHVRFGDDALLLGIEAFEGLDITLGNIKMAENNLASADDLDAYALIAAYQINKVSRVGLDISYINGRGGEPGSWLIGSSGTFGSTLPVLVDLHLWNFGINGATRIAGLGVKAEINIQRGKGSLNSSSLDDFKFRGYAFTADADYYINPVTLKAGIGYGSGTETDYTPVLDGKVKTFLTAQSYIQHYTFIYDYFIANAAGNIAGGLQNTLYIRFGSAMDITKDLHADMTAYYLKAAKTGPNFRTGRTISKEIGVEIDGSIRYSIDRNLTYFVEGGYLFSGDFFKGGNPDRNIDDAWAVRHGVQLSF